LPNFAQTLATITIQLFATNFRLNNMKVAVLTFSLLLISTISLSQCTSFNMTLVGHDPICHNYTDGAISITTSGGNGSLTVTITDSTGTLLNTIPGGTDNILGGGMWYYVEVIDDSSCYLIDSVYLINPPPILAQLTFTDPTSLGACDGIASVDTVLTTKGIILISHFSGVLVVLAE
jgi:hypothetical protein